MNLVLLLSTGLRAYWDRHLPCEIASMAAAGKNHLHVKLRFWQPQSAKTTISHKKPHCEERSDEAPEKQTHRLS
jgi:hypothetical protein